MRSSWKAWLFRGLVAVAAGLMIASFIMPWWSTTHMVASNEAEFHLPRDVIRIYGHGLQHDLVQLREYIELDETPFYQTVLAWVYLGVSVGFILISIWLRGKRGRWLLGGIGLIYIAYAAIAAFVVIAGRLADFGYPLQGWGFYDSGAGEGASICGALRFGYYLVYAAGLMCIALALLRNKIIGKPKLSA